MQSLPTIVDAFGPIRSCGSRRSLVDDPRLGIPQARLESFEGTDSADTELTHWRDELRGSLRIDDPLFGVLVFDSGRGEFWTVTDWRDQPVRLDLDAETKLTAQRALRRAHELWQNQTEWDERVLRRMIEELLPLKNERWLSASERPVAAGFQRTPYALRNRCRSRRRVRILVRRWVSVSGPFHRHRRVACRGCAKRYDRGIVPAGGRDRWAARMPTQPNRFRGDAQCLGLNALLPSLKPQAKK